MQIVIKLIKVVVCRVESEIIKNPPQSSSSKAKDLAAGLFYIIEFVTEFTAERRDR